MTTHAATSPDAARHRLLEGVLLRLARQPEARAFILRGGMLLRHWFRPVPRPVEDIDLVATFPFDLAEATRRILPVLADDSIADGATFDTTRVRVEGIWLESGSPGVRTFVEGAVEGVEVDFHIDTTFGPFPRPEPILASLPTACGATAEVWACRPESVAGHKAQALWHRGVLGWRPKDLDDFRLLLVRVPVDATALRDAVLAYLADVGGTANDARTLFSLPWWGTKMTAARWMDFARSCGRDVPKDVSAIVTDLAGRLAPIWEDSP